MPVELLCVDADDTLWHNMRHFAAAETAFAELMAPFAGAGVSRARLEDVEMRNLARYGYGAKSMTLSMLETAVELCGERVDQTFVTRILAAGRELLAHPVELLPGVAETLEALASRVRLVLVTKGDLLHQETKLAASGLGDLFTGVEIVSDKRADTFTRVFARYGMPAERAAMAGDSLRSDVLPALVAGAFAAYLPHEIVWAHERADEPVGHARYSRLARFDDLPGWLAAL